MIDCYVIKDGFDPYLHLWEEQRRALQIDSEWLFVTKVGDQYV